jgi:tetratricopeptide (TPR) repeat protein
MQLSWFEGINYQFAGYVHPTQRGGTFGAGIYYLSAGNIAAYDNDGAELTGGTAVSDLALGLSYCNSVKRIRGLEAGATMKIAQENLSGEPAAAPLLDIGLLYRINLSGNENEFKAALVAQNLGPAIKFARDNFLPPQNITLGISCEILDETLVLASDANLPADRAPFLDLGLSYRIADLIVLRAGYKLSPDNSPLDSDQGLRCGIGLGNNYMEVDYAFAPYGVLGGTHRLSLTYKFGKGYGIGLIEKNIERHVLKGKSYYLKKDLLGAYREFSSVLILDPVNDEAKRYLQDIKDSTGRIVTAKQLDTAKKYLDEDRLDDAKAELDNILALFPDNQQAKDYRDQLNARLDKRAKQRIEAMYSQGLEFYRLNEFDEAISMFGKVLLLDPSHAGAKENISLARGKLDEIENAKKEKEKENLAGQSREALEKGLKEYKSGNLEKARAQFEEALRLDPANAQGRDYLDRTKKELSEKYSAAGRKYYDERNLGESLKNLQKANSLVPEKQDIKELLDKVRTEYTQQNKSKAEDYNRAALVEYTQGNPAKAVEYWEKALALDPENTKIQNSLERAKADLEKGK